MRLWILESSIPTEDPTIIPPNCEFRRRRKYFCRCIRWMHEDMVTSGSNSTEQWRWRNHQRWCCEAVHHTELVWAVEANEDYYAVRTSLAACGFGENLWWQGCCFQYSKWEAHSWIFFLLQKTCIKNIAVRRNGTVASSDVNFHIRVWRLDADPAFTAPKTQTLSYKNGK